MSTDIQKIDVYFNKIIRKVIGTDTIAKLEKAFNEQQLVNQLARLNSGLDMDGKRLPKYTPKYNLFKRYYISGKLKHRAKSTSKKWYRNLYDNNYDFRAKGMPSHGRLRGRTLSKIIFESTVRRLQDRIKFTFWTYTKDKQARLIIEGNKKRWKRDMYGGVANKGNVQKKEIEAFKKIFKRITRFSL